MKIDIKYNEPGYTYKCVICGRIPSDRYYDVDINYTENGIINDIHRVMCLDCNLTLQRHYRRDLE